MSQETKKPATCHCCEGPIKVNTVSRHLGAYRWHMCFRSKKLMVRDICESNYI
jgi:hypothetical protein